MKLRFIILSMLLCAQWAMAAPSATKIQELDSWLFRRADESGWTKVKLPHSTNAVDGQSAKYYRGDATYRTEIRVSKKNEHNYFLLFKAAAQAAEVRVNGQQATIHKGGYTPFTVDITPYVREGSNEVEVTTNNEMDLTMPPVSSDFNKNNGLHDRVFLLTTGPVYIDTQTMGYTGLHVQQKNVSEKRADIIVETQLMNSLVQPQKAQVEVTVTDAKGKVVAEDLQSLTLAGTGRRGQRFSQVLTLYEPHLWSGLEDPYLYHVQLQVKVDGKAVENRSIRIGLRSFYMDPDKGFILNGRYYPLRGVSMHQDKYLRASALTEADIRRDFEDIRELGCNFIRLAHYPHSELTFDLCDELGIVVQTEIPWVNECGPDTTRFDQRAFQRNIVGAFQEMVRGHYNHPSIVFWGMWNELGNTHANHAQGQPLDRRFMGETSQQMYQWGQRNDPDRYYGLAAMDNVVNTPELVRGQNFDYFAVNQYHGWYGNNRSPEGARSLQAYLDDLHKKRGTVAISEYGAGISPFCHSDNPASTTNPSSGGARHDEEWGNILHEISLEILQRSPYLQYSSAWVLYDFAVASRKEGYLVSENMTDTREEPSNMYINDKGFITRDRKVKKDVFYLYKAAWNKRETTVYISSRRYTERPGNEVTLKVYSNATQLSLYQNGRLVETLKGSHHPTGVVWTFSPVTFQKERDTFRVEGLDADGRKIVDQVTWSHAL